MLSMMSWHPGFSSTIRTGFRFVLGVPVAFFLAALAMMAIPVFDGPGFGFGSDSLTCAVLMQIASPYNWWIFIALDAAITALFAYVLDRFLTRWFGGYGHRASVGLGVIVFTAIVLFLALGNVGVFC